MSTGGLDPNGIYQYGEDDSPSPFSSFMNLLASSVSSVIGTLKSSVSTLTTAVSTLQQKSARTVGTFGYASGMSNLSGATSKLSIKDDEVHWHAAIACTSTINAGFTIGTLPAGYRPLDQVVTTGQLVASGSPGTVSVLIAANGVVTTGGAITQTGSKELKFDVHFLNS